MRLYHLSPRRFTVIRCDHDSKKKGRVWLCDKKRIPWAMRHLAEHHGQEMRYCYTVDVDARLLQTFRSGIYIVHGDLVPVERVKLALPDDSFEVPWLDESWRNGDQA